MNNNTCALSVFNRILQAYPNILWVLDDKAIALTHLGNYTNAIATINKFLSIEPNGRYAFYQKDMALIGLGIHTHNLKDLGTALQNVDQVLNILLFS